MHRIVFAVVCLKNENRRGARSPTTYKSILAARYRTIDRKIMNIYERK